MFISLHCGESLEEDFTPAAACRRLNAADDDGAIAVFSAIPPAIKSCGRCRRSFEYYRYAIRRFYETPRLFESRAIASSPMAIASPHDELPFSQIDVSAQRRAATTHRPLQPPPQLPGLRRRHTGRRASFTAPDGSPTDDAGARLRLTRYLLSHQTTYAPLPAALSTALAVIILTAGSTRE